MWTYNGVVMPVVNVYKHLSIYFTTRLSFVSACKDLASGTKNALLCILQRLCMLNSSVEVFLKLFKAQVQPVVQHGSELWGLEKAAVHFEKVHLFALKKVLALDIRTPNDLVYGETDRFPITLNSAIRCIRYWLKLTCMDETDCRVI